jgi:flagellar capping protein FliD
MDTAQFVTKTDLMEALDAFSGRMEKNILAMEDRLMKRMEKMVGDVVGEIVGDALQMISERFDTVDKRFEEVDKRLDRMDARLDRIEKKLDKTRDITDHHTIDIRALQRGKA